MMKPLRFLVFPFLTVLALGGESTTVKYANVPASPGAQYVLRAESEISMWADVAEVTDRRFGIDLPHEVPVPCPGHSHAPGITAQQVLDSLGPAGTKHVDTPWIPIEAGQYRGSPHLPLLTGPKRFIGMIGSVSRAASVVGRAKKAGMFDPRAPASRTNPEGMLLDMQAGEAAVRIAPSFIIFP
jgi:hypothetical protein